MRYTRALSELRSTTRPSSSRSRRILACLGTIGLVAGLSTVVTAGALPASAAVTAPSSSDPITYGYTGAPTAVTVPANTQMAFVQATGGSGGGATGGATGGFGATVDGAFYVTPGEQIQIAVGQSGLSGAPGWGEEQYFGGTPGGSGWSNSDGPVVAGGGGGATVVSTGTGPLIVAGGGGGGGASAHDAAQYPSEPAGGDGGAAGATPADGATGVGGTAGGAGIGGAGGGDSTVSGGDGAAAVTQEGGTFGQGGGGGGGSAHGGAGGAVGTGDTGFGGGGGGGGGQSSIDPSVFDSSVATAAALGDGSVVLSWIRDVTVTATPLPATVTASSAPQPLGVTAVDNAGNVLPDPSGFVTWTSTDQTDVFSSAGVVMTNAGNRTIAASWNGDPANSSSFQVSVVAGPLTGFKFVAPIPTSRTVTPGTQVIFGVEGIDDWGNFKGDATEDVTYSSSVASDVFSAVNPNEVTVTAPGAHVFTASYTGYPSAAVTVTVAAATQRLGTNPPPAGTGTQGHTVTGSSDPGTAVAATTTTETGNPAPVAGAAADLAPTGRTLPVGPIIAGLAVTIAGITLYMATSLRRSIRRRSS